MNRLTLSLLLSTGLLCASPVLAQEKGQPVEPTKAQAAQITTIGQKYDRMVLDAFKGEEKLLSAMQAEIKVASAEKDPDKRRAATKSYQAKYGADYKRLLVKSKVDLNALAKELTSAWPAERWVVKDGLYLVALAPQPPAATPAPKPIPAKRVITPSRSDYTRIGPVPCSGIGDGSVTFPGSAPAIANEVWVAEIGSCTGRGEMRYAFDLPEDMKGRIDIKADLIGDVFAGGYGGFSKASMEASISLQSAAGFSLPGLNINTYAPCSVWVMVLWMASEHCPVYDGRFSGTFDIATQYTVFAATRTRVQAATAIGKAESSARIETLDVTLNLDPK